MDKKEETKKEVIIREGEYKFGEKTEAVEATEDIEKSGNNTEKTKEQELPSKEEKTTRLKRRARRKFFGRIKIAVIALVLSCVAVFAYMNRDNLKLENISIWLKSNVLSSVVGDGYPEMLNGSNVDSRNISSYNGNIAYISDTNFTILNATGAEIVNFLHSYENPNMASNQGRYIIFDVGTTEYTIINADNSYDTRETEDNITCVAIAANGTYAIVTRPSDYSSKVSVYFSDGTLKCSYNFAQSYAVAVAINDDGTAGLVARVDSEDGMVYTKLSYFDFSETTEIDSYISENNIIFDIEYNNGEYYGIGELACVSFDGSEFDEFDYSDKKITAYDSSGEYTLISLTDYDGGGLCTVYLLGGEEIISVSIDGTVNGLSSYGSTFAVFTSGTVYSYHISGEYLAQTSVGYDTKNIVLSNESEVYALALRYMYLESFIEE